MFLYFLLHFLYFINIYQILLDFSQEKRARLYKIGISDFRLIVIIGLLDKERTTPQEIVVDFECEYNSSDEFVDYAIIKDIISTTLEDGKFELLETAISKLHKNITKKYKYIKNIKIKISKTKIFSDCDVSILGLF